MSCIVYHHEHAYLIRELCNDRDSRVCNFDKYGKGTNEYICTIGYSLGGTSKLNDVDYVNYLFIMMAKVSVILFSK